MLIYIKRKQLIKLLLLLLLLLLFKADLKKKIYSRTSHNIATT